MRNMTISETIDDDTIRQIILYRVEMQEKFGESGWISNDDPFQKIVLNMIASKKYSQQEVNDWSTKQEEIIKEKLISIKDDLEKTGLR